MRHREISVGSLSHRQDIFIALPQYLSNVCPLPIDIKYRVTIKFQCTY